MNRVFKKIKDKLESLISNELELYHHNDIHNNAIYKALDVIKEIKEEYKDKYVSRGLLDQVRWERDVALSQLEELGYGLGREIWVNVKKRLPEGCKDAEIELLITTYDDEYGYETHFALYYPDGNRFHSVYNRLDITEHVVAWQYMPRSYKGEDR